MVSTNLNFYWCQSEIKTDGFVVYVGKTYMREMAQLENDDKEVSQGAGVGQT